LGSKRRITCRTAQMNKVGPSRRELREDPRLKIIPYFQNTKSHFIGEPPQPSTTKSATQQETRSTGSSAANASNRAQARPLCQGTESQWGIGQTRATPASRHDWLDQGTRREQQRVDIIAISQMAYRGVEGKTGDVANMRCPGPRDPHRPLGSAQRLAIRSYSRHTLLSELRGCSLGNPMWSAAEGGTRTTRITYGFGDPAIPPAITGSGPRIPMWEWAPVERAPFPEAQ